MRTIKVKRSDTGEEREISIRPLKRKEIKELAAYGYTCLYCVPKHDTAQDSVNKALEAVLTEKDQAFLDECDNLVTQTVWQDLLKETYGDKEEEKNSGNTTDGISTKSE